MESYKSISRHVRQIWVYSPDGTKTTSLVYDGLFRLRFHTILHSSVGASGNSSLRLKYGIFDWEARPMVYQEDPCAKLPMNLVCHDASLRYGSVARKPPRSFLTDSLTEDQKAPARGDVAVVGPRLRRQAYFFPGCQSDEAAAAVSEICLEDIAFRPFALGCEVVTSTTETMVAFKLAMA